MYYYFYQITNKVNGKIYVGVHKTTDLNDGYMGSGKVIKRAIAKHGLKNFTKDILEFFENAELMYAHETQIVTEEFLSRKDVYNLRRGGTGGFDHIQKSPHYKEWTKKGGHAKKASRTPKQTEALLQHVKTNQFLLKQKLIDNGGVAWWKPRQTFLGKRHTESTKAKMRKAKIGVCEGSANSQYGTIWITNGINNKKLNSSSQIPLGWRKGRIIQNH
jgi:group I intron endonuclease